MERKRLYLQAKKYEGLREVYDFNTYLPSFVESVKEKYRDSPVELRVGVEFDLEKMYESYWRSLIDNLENFETTTKRDGKNIYLEIRFKTSPHNLINLLNTLTSPRSLHFSNKVCIMAGELKLLFYDQRKIRLMEELGIPKVPWSYRLTAHREEKDEVMRLLNELFQIEEVCETILLQTRGRECAYEKIHIVGEPEEHVRWRKRDYFSFIKVYLNTRDDLISLVEKERACAFYFKPKSVVKFENKNLAITTRNVIEFDPRGKIPLPSSVNIVKNFLNVLDENGISYIYGHSGSKSPRVHMEIDSLSLLSQLQELEKEYPFLGFVPLGSGKSLEERYERLIKAFNQGLLLLTIENSRHDLNYMCWRKGRKTGLLFDFPKAASICFGSPKALVEVRQKERKELNREVKKLREYPLPRILTLATPLANTEIPFEKLEILKLTNLVSAVERIHSYIDEFKRRMKKKVGVEEVRRVLNQVDEEVLRDFNLKEEKEFKQIYGVSSSE